MEIVYDEFDNVRFRLDDGREFKLVDLLADLEKVEKLETALTLVTTSREWNRKRVVELEDTLERLGRLSDYPSPLDWAAVRAERDRLKERVAELERALAKSVQRETELEAQNQRLTEYANAQEARHAELAAATTRVRAARDRLLAAATTRVREATEILSRPVVVGARNDIVTTKGAILAEAIGNALDALNA